MLTKNRIRLFIALGIILIIGFSNSLLNLRPVSERKKNKQEKLDTKKELKNALDKIASLTDSISKFQTKADLYLKRARFYKSINKFDKAIVDYKIFIEKNTDSVLNEIADKELKSCKEIQSYYNKMKN